MADDRRAPITAYPRVMQAVFGFPRTVLVTFCFLSLLLPGNRYNRLRVEIDSAKTNTGFGPSAEELFRTNDDRPALLCDNACVGEVGPRCTRCSPCSSRFVRIWRRSSRSPSLRCSSAAVLTLNVASRALRLCVRHRGLVAQMGAWKYSRRRGVSITPLGY